MICKYQIEIFTNIESRHLKPQQKYIFKKDLDYKLFDLNCFVDEYEVVRLKCRIQVSILKYECVEKVKYLGFVFGLCVISVIK